MNTKFSVAMSVYKNDNPQDFETAVHSIYEQQSLRPSEIILVIDGPVPAIMHDTISALNEQIDILRVIQLKENMGHAIARQTGLDAARNELCAIMDADDISVPNRFEKQLKAFEEHPEVSVVGGLIREFIHQPDNVVGTRIVPEHDTEIKNYLKTRCPMNLMTVMFKKSDIMKVGGFMDWYCEEDYYLWIRLTLGGYKFYNLQENLVNVRVGKEMYQRRGGMKYFKSEARLQKYMLNKDIINWGGYLSNVTKRLIVQVLLPNKIRGWVFRTFARE